MENREMNVKVVWKLLSAFASSDPIPQILFNDNPTVCQEPKNSNLSLQLSMFNSWEFICTQNSSLCVIRSYILRIVKCFAEEQYFLYSFIWSFLVVDNSKRIFYEEDNLCITLQWWFLNQNTVKVKWIDSARWSHFPFLFSQIHDWLS